MRVTKEMALTEKMFFDTLPRALDSDAYQVDGHVVTLAGEGRTLSVTFAAKADFKLGMMRVPRADVTLEFIGYGDAQADAALARFLRYFHRGGG